MHAFRSVSAAACLALAVPTVQAQADAPAGPPPTPASTPAAAPPAAPAPVTSLGGITNAATRTDRGTDTLPGTVTLRSAAQAEAAGARDLKDLFRDEVDLAVRQQPLRYTAAGASTGRAGNEGLNIRGLEGNQVLVLVDGVRAPQAFAFGAFATGRLDTLFIESLAQADVLRGPASAAFGSDGLAGALSLRTLDPEDLLPTGRTLGGFVRLGGSSVDDSAAASAALAGRGAGWQWLVLGSRREAHEIDNQGSDEAADSRRTRPNPMALRQTGVLGKLVHTPRPGHRVGLTLEAVDRRTEVEVLSARSVPPAAPATPAATAVLDLDAADRQERQRVALDWRHEDLEAPWVQQASARLYGQTTRIRQTAIEDRFSAADRRRDGLYEERLRGLSAQASSTLTGPVAQRVSVGLDLSENQIRATRDGTVPPAGETFPSRPFPDTSYRLMGAFVQSEIELGADRGFALIPGLRFDRYELSPDATGYTASAVVPLADQAVTPRLGAVWTVSPQFRPYAQWSRGFRAPQPDQVNNGFTNAASGYRSIGNPQLAPERAESREIGLRGSAGAFSWQLAAYDNRYRDFISQEVIGGAFTPADPAVFQYVNLASARIRGAELRAAWQPAAGWRVSAAHASARGDSLVGGSTRPLISIEPAKTQLGLQRDGDRLSWRASVVHVQAKDADRIPAATPVAFATPAATTLDLGATWRPTRALALHLTVDNATDETHWRWSDVRGLSSTSPVKDAFTAPGRSVSLTARLDF